MKLVSLHTVLILALLLPVFSARASDPAARRVVLLTGYWPPTNEMMRPWSKNPVQNPAGWVGGNWEGLGYDVQAFFPEFPDGMGRGSGDLEVDWKDTRKDFRKLTTQLKPVAILSFGLGDGPWEIEANATDYWFGTGNRYRTTLPREAIQKAVSEQTRLTAWIDDRQDAGDYLCGYISLLGARYAVRHGDPQDPAHLKAQGFIHVGSGYTAQDYRAALEATLRATLQHLNSSTP